MSRAPAERESRLFTPELSQQATTPDTGGTAHAPGPPVNNCRIAEGIDERAVSLARAGCDEIQLPLSDIPARRECQPPACVFRRGKQHVARDAIRHHSPTSRFNSSKQSRDNPAFTRDRPRPNVPAGRRVISANRPAKRVPMKTLVIHGCDQMWVRWIGRSVAR